MKYFTLSLFILIVKLSAFQTSNVQVLYSNNFDGDAFIYDTKDDKKLTLTLEHYRTWDYGDLFMFADSMTGKRFDDSRSGIYAEVSPRFSFSKMTNHDLKMGIVQDIYIATQVNLGRDYQAYLYGLGIDLSIPLFDLFSLNIYEKQENINKHDDTYQITTVYSTKSFYNIHAEGFIDITKRDINTQNQVLYSIDAKKNLFLGMEWLYYSYKYERSNSKASVIQAMIKCKF
ncbi:MAG: outer membrane protein OmpK [Sulfurimonas sp.]|nr:outer membrane protein OmpK [Sulfurimonas sp.]MDQ7062404.1 outer membrane protein OmpK [Sulfurimonas sp.]